MDDFQWANDPRTTQLADEYRENRERLREQVRALTADNAALLEWVSKHGHRIGDRLCPYTGGYACEPGCDVHSVTTASHPGAAMLAELEALRAQGRANAALTQDASGYKAQRDRLEDECKRLERERDTVLATLAAKDARIAEMEIHLKAQRHELATLRTEYDRKAAGHLAANKRAMAAESAIATLRQAVIHPENLLGPSLSRALRRADMNQKQYTLNAEEVACVARLIVAMQNICNLSVTPSEHRDTAIPQLPVMPVGFAGTRVRTIGEVTDGDEHPHTVRLALYRFHDGNTSPYVEVFETGGPHTGSAIYPVSAVVHVLINLGQMEVFDVERRRPGVPYEHPDTATLRGIRERAEMLRVGRFSSELPERVREFISDSCWHVGQWVVSGDAVLGDSGPSGGGERAARCLSCPHPPHLGPCTRRNGQTANPCPCLKDTVPTTPPDVAEVCACSRPLNHPDEPDCHAACGLLRHVPGDVHCILPKGHEGPHDDGTDTEEVNQPTPTPEEDWRVVEEALSTAESWAENKRAMAMLEELREGRAALARIKAEPRRAAEAMLTKCKDAVSRRAAYIAPEDDRAEFAAKVMADIDSIQPE